MSGPQPTLPVHDAATQATGAVPPGMGSFARVHGGYDPAQVDGHILDLRGNIKVLEDRIRRLLHGGAHEAEQVAESPRAQKTIEDLLQAALDQITGQRAAAEQQAAQAIADATAHSAQLVSDAQAQASQVLAGAQDEAGRVVSGAHEQAASLLSDARASAQSTLDQANAKAAAVSEGAARRLDGLTQLHAQTLAHLEEIHQVSGVLLNSEAQRGSLDAEVTNITRGVVVPAGAPAALTAPPA